jgi:DNA-binding PadR family transcriptional regulator
VPKSKDPTTTGHALLGLLALRPWTTYELAQQVQRSLGWFWPRAERRLYDEPKQLVARGLATASEERTGKRPRTVYEITPAGRAALEAWPDKPSSPPVLEFEAMIRVFFADGGTLEQLGRTLDGVEAAAQAKLADLRSMIENATGAGYEFSGRLPVNALSLRFELDHQQLLVDWARWAREQITTWKSTADAAGWDWYAALA